MGTRTPGPWKISSGFLVAPTFPGTEGTPHFPMYELDRVVGDKADDEADRAFIVRACNAHDELATQLRGMVAAFRCVLADLGISGDDVRLRIMAGDREIADVPVETLLTNANAALAMAESTP